MFILLFLVACCWLTFNLASKRNKAEAEIVAGSSYKMICAQHSKELGEIVTDEMGDGCRLRGEVIVRSEYLEDQVMGALFCQVLICPPERR